MYEDLIKYLRVCAREEDVNYCRGCPFNSCKDATCMDKLMEAAADSIEALTAVEVW